MIIKEQGKKQVYSDDSETERRLLDIAKNYPEDLSQDYIADNSEYIVNNTFSAVRHNILNWYPFKKDAVILEIGAGMGAITGMLCDRARSVTALEMSEARAEVIKARYPERKNLKIVSENINNWECDSKFDYVVFIGVLEYAGVFSDAFNPYEEFLANAKRFLKDDGVLLFAIENRFGLKYWVGGSEDHLQQPFVGIDGYKEPKTARTFSEIEINTMLDNVGLGNHRMYYVYPDYKFPEIICTNEFKPSYTNLKKLNFTYSKNSTLFANEKELYKHVIDNDVWRFMANSFLVEASASDLEEKHVIHVSGKSECKKEYRTSTLIYNDGEIAKVPMHDKASEHIDRIFKNNEMLKNRNIKVVDIKKKNGCLYSSFCDKKAAQDYFVELLVDNNYEGLCDFISKYKNELVKSSDVTGEDNIIAELSDIPSNLDYGVVLKDGYVDMTMYNAFYDDGEFIFYDQEWNFANVPLDFILYYSLKSSYCRLDVNTEISFEKILDYIGIDKVHSEIYDKLESYIWSKILYRQTDFYGEGGYCRRYDKELRIEYIEDQKRIETDRKEKELAISKNIIDTLRNELDQKNNELMKKNAEIEQKNAEIEQKNAEIEQKNAEIEQKNITINNQQGHIAQLLETDRYYHQIVASKGWRLVSFPGKVFEKMYPRGTKRRERISKEYRYITAFNPTNIKFVADAYRRGGIDQVKAEMHAFNRRVDNERAQDAIQKPQTIKEHEITDISQCKKLIFKHWDEPVVSIVIPVYNQFTYTYNCLRTIRRNSGKVKYEIIIADDVSNDLTTKLSEVTENITVIRNEKNQRFLLNCNNAAKYAKGKYILFLNNDTQVQENWLEPLVTLIESKDDIGMVGSKLIYPDGTLQEAGGIIWGDAPGHAWNYGNGQNPAEPEFNYVKEVDYISGASLMIKTSLWKEIGGFDEYFAPAYCEDSDLAFEVRKRGYKVMYQPLSVVVHFEGKSNGTDTSTGVKKYQVENSEKLMKKWTKEFANEQSHSETEVFKARERSQRKKTILVIDHYVPQFDKDAGSKTTWQYLKMFVKQGYNVKFMGDNFYQDEPYTTKLQQLGIEVLYGPWYANNYKQWIIDHKNDIDFVYLNRPHITEKYIDFLKNETNIKCIYYGHDLHFLRIHREYELNGNEELLKESEEWKSKEFAIMKKADINYYPSYVEVDEIHKLEPGIKAKAITAYVFEEFRKDIDVDFSKKNGILFVGGFGHPPNEDAVLWFAKEVYPSIKKEQDIPFYIVGSNVTESVEKLQGDGIILKGFVTEEELQELYNTCRIVVVPLRYGAGVKGKVVEALYYGTPMVTTTVGIEGIRDAEKFMEVADEATVFAEKVLALYNDPERLMKTVDDYQNYVKENNSVDAVWKIVEEDFQ